MKYYIVVTDQNYADHIVRADYYDIVDGCLDLFLKDETLVATFSKDFWKAIVPYFEKE